MNWGIESVVDLIAGCTKWPSRLLAKPFPSIAPGAIIEVLKISTKGNGSIYGVVFVAGLVGDYKLGDSS